MAFYRCTLGGGNKIDPLYIEWRGSGKFQGFIPADIANQYKYIAIAKKAEVPFNIYADATSNYQFYVDRDEQRAKVNVNNGAGTPFILKADGTPVEIASLNITNNVGFSRTNDGWESLCIKLYN